MEEAKEKSGGGIGQVTVDYGEVMNFEPLNGSQILNERITDTYVTQSDNEDKMMGELDKMCTYLFEKRHGFAGFMAWAYAMMTMMYLLKKYDKARIFISQMTSCLDMIESHLFTGNYKLPNGQQMPFTNFSYGESEDAIQQSLKFAEDSYNTARLIHKKAGSFESGYSLLNCAILYHTAVDNVPEAQADCKYMRELLEHLDEFMAHLEANPEDDAAQKTEMTFDADIDELRKKQKIHFMDMDEFSAAVSRSVAEKSVFNNMEVNNDNN